jgi:hypothetical protein
MARFAVIKDGVVVNVIIADSVESAQSVTTLQCVETNTNNIGDLYADGEFTTSITETSTTVDDDPEIVEETNKMLNGLPLTPEEELKLSNFIEANLAAEEE